MINLTLTLEITNFKKIQMEKLLNKVLIYKSQIKVLYTLI